MTGDMVERMSTESEDLTITPIAAISLVERATVYFTIDPRGSC